MERLTRTESLQRGFLGPKVTRVAGADEKNEGRLPREILHCPLGHLRTKGRAGHVQPKVRFCAVRCRGEVSGQGLMGISSSLIHHCVIVQLSGAHWGSQCQHRS